MKQVNRHQIGGLFLLLLAACQPLSASAMGTFDFQQAADNQAARWEAVARFYGEMGFFEPLAGSVRMAERPLVLRCLHQLRLVGAFLLREQRAESALIL
jgi:hypothetical protein